MRKRCVGFAILLVVADWTRGAPGLPEPAAPRRPIPAGAVGALSPEFYFPVENGLRLISVDGRQMIAGKTNTSKQYQIQSRPVALKSTTTMLSLSLGGEIVSGRMYVGLLDDHGRFLVPTYDLYRGPMHDLEIVVPSRGSRTVDVVLGNAQPVQGSEWRVWRIELSQSHGIPVEYLRRLGFVGSAWRWAFHVLLGAR